MKRPLAACRYVCGSLAAITAVTSALPVTAAANTSSANFDMRRQVVNLTGILNVTDYTGQVTRGDFARMLVNASSYRGKPAFFQRVRVRGCAGYPSGCCLYPHRGFPGMDDRFPGRAL
mgnify:CR=1 FL=1